MTSRPWLLSDRAVGRGGDYGLVYRRPSLRPQKEISILGLSRTDSHVPGYLVAQPHGIFRLGQGEEEARMAAGESVMWSCPGRQKGS
ncbi:hypothetical protein ABFV05_020568 [Capra hircus]